MSSFFAASMLEFETSPGLPGWHLCWLPDLLPVRTAVSRHRIPAMLGASTPWLPERTAGRTASPGSVVETFP